MRASSVIFFCLLAASIVHASVPHRQPSHDYLEDSATGAILYAPDPYPDGGFTFRYRSPHDPANPDGQSPPQDYRDGDYSPKFYAQVLLAAEAGGLTTPYCALRIEPDQLSVVAYDGGEEVEVLDSVAVATEANEWYTVQLRIVAGGPEGMMLSVERTSETPGESFIALMRATPM